MSKTSKIIIAVLLVAVLLLGIGYAAIQSVTLNISGTAAADPNQENFKVMFTGTPEVSDEEHVTASITDDINATINVSGLTKKGEIVSATYTVQNASTDLSADLSVATTNSNTEYFTLSSKLAKTSLIAGEATTVTVTVEVTKTPLAESVSSTIGVQLIATPVQPGEEGTSGATNDYSQTPEPPIELTNDRIGDYIDLGNNIIGTESTADDWRIFYKDEDRVYVILADYLPAEQVPIAAGLDTDPTTYSYSVWSDTGVDTLLNGLKNEAAWSSFANEIEGATAIGSPTRELFVKSFQNKGGEVFTEENVDNTIEDFDLYFPQLEVVNETMGYWLASKHYDSTGRIYAICSNDSFHGVSYYEYSDDRFCLRPVVSLPSSIDLEYVDGVWILSK